MGKRLIQQRRGKGSFRYRVPSHRFLGSVEYPSIKETIGGQVIDILHDPARTAPIAKILLENFKEIQIIAPEGIRVGQWIKIGKSLGINNGDILPLGEIPEGTEVYNIELHPGDGGKLVRTSGTSAYVIVHDKTSGISQIRLPSKRIVNINSNSLATIGRVAGGDRTEMPFLRAGQAFYAHRARNKRYPHIHGASMNAMNHPHGGGRNPHGGGGTSVPRGASPGQKVGHLAPRRTGRKKR